MQPHVQDEDGQPATDLQYNRWTPGDYAAEEDQHHPGATVFQNFKAALLAEEQPQGPGKLLGDLKLRCVQELTLPDVRVSHFINSQPICTDEFAPQPSWPLSSFAMELDLPSADGIQILSSAAISQLSLHFSGLQNTSTTSFTPGRDYLLLSLAAVGAALQNSPYRIALGIHANRTLTATLAINNSKLREPNAHVAVSVLYNQNLNITA